MQSKKSSGIRVPVHSVGHGACHCRPILGPKFQHRQRGPSDYDNQTPPSNAGAAYLRFPLRRIQANLGTCKVRRLPYRRPPCTY